MGASQSCPAKAAADRGWPAYMSTEALRRAMLSFPAEKSVLSDRVRFLEGEARVEYVRLPGAKGSNATYQRRDGEGLLPAFPRFLARQELPAATDMPHEVVEATAGQVRVRHPGNNALATYVLRAGGVWTRDELGTVLPELRGLREKKIGTHQ